MTIHTPNAPRVTSGISEKERRENVRPTVLNSLKRSWHDRELLVNLVQRDLRARYRRSVLGWGWAMINPAVTTAVYGFVFTVFFHIKPKPGDPSGLRNFAFFLLAGILPWNVLQNGVNIAIGALLGGGAMMQKVYFARDHLVGGPVYAMVVSFLIELGVLATLELVTGHVMLQLIPVVLVLVLLLSMFVMGVALFFASLNIRYRDVQHLTSVFFLVWFYLTPVVYPIQLIPMQYSVWGRTLPLRSIFLLNPMARFLQAFRNCFFDIRLPGINTMVALVLISLGTFLAGYRFFIRRAPWFVEEL